MWDKRLDEYFWMGTFYATKLKILKSLRQNTYYELFIIDKGYRFIYSMKKQLDILSALILFTKGVGVPEALVTDSSWVETSAEVKKFCINISNWKNLNKIYLVLTS